MTDKKEILVQSSIQSKSIMICLFKKKCARVACAIVKCKNKKSEDS